MSMQYIRDYYNVPAKRGGKIKFRGEQLVIIGSDGARLRVCPPDTPPGHRRLATSTIHPTWEVEYQ